MSVDENGRLRGTEGALDSAAADEDSMAASGRAEAETGADQDATAGSGRDEAEKGALGSEADDQDATAASGRAEAETGALGSEAAALSWSIGCRMGMMCWVMAFATCSRTWGCAPASMVVMRDHTTYPC